MTLFTDGRYALQAKQEVYAGVGVEIVTNILQAVRTKLQTTATNRRILFEPEALSFADWQRWLRALSHYLLIPFGAGADALRQIKDREELDALHKAGQIADEALQEALQDWSQYRTEDDLRRAIENACYRRGARAVPFEFIVAQGKRSALPHGVASQRVLDDLPLTVDWGAEYNGYYSDQTVTVVPARERWDRKWQQRYATVFRAQQAGLAALIDGVQAWEVDDACRSVLVEAGLGKLFVHSTGHGVGLAIHEAPRVAPHSSSVLSKGTVVTVEPGVYEEDWGGIRLEDTVVVTSNGFKRLTGIDKQEPIFLTL